MEYRIYAILIAFVIDAIIGDPHSFPHPIVFIGKLISKSEKLIRKTIKNELISGAILVANVLFFTGIVPFFMLYFTNGILNFAITIIMFWQIIAAKSLYTESMKVKKALELEGLEQGRVALSMIVGRDTKELSKTAVIKATVETIAENTTDGVVAPLIYCLFFGPAGGFIYKAINTMDSMVGYKNEKYILFGRCAAKLDDVVNFIPARISAILMIWASFLLGFNAKNAISVFFRDRNKHSSPNAGQTESVVAGALGIELLGDAYYGEVLFKKQSIGNKLREIRVDDILLTNRIMYLSSMLLMLLFSIPIIL